MCNSNTSCNVAGCFSCRPKCCHSCCHSCCQSHCFHPSPSGNIGTITTTGTTTGTLYTWTTNPTPNTTYKCCRCGYSYTIYGTTWTPGLTITGGNTGWGITNSAGGITIDASAPYTGPATSGYVQTGCTCGTTGACSNCSKK